MENLCTNSPDHFISRSSIKRLGVLLLLLMLLPLVAFSQKGKKKGPVEKQWKKVTICHDGNTIEISENALQAHLNHGDGIGPCKDISEYTGTVNSVLESRGKVDDIIGAELTALVESYALYGSAASNEIFVISENSHVLIEIVAQRGSKQDVINLLNTYGITEFIVNQPSIPLITVLFPIDKLPDLNLQGEIIRFVTPVYQALTNSGVVTSLGDVAQQSDNARNAFGLDGTGAKIAVLSDSYNLKGNASSDVANRDLPGPGNPDNSSPVAVLKEYPVSSIGSWFSTNDEGRAMLQIIHDVAPKAELGFRTGIISPSDMAAGIIDLQAAGYNMIVDDITFFKEPFYKDGVVAQAVNQVTALGVEYFTSAGNFGDNSYEAQFNPVGDTHNFNLTGSENTMQQISLGIGFVRIVLQWDDNYFSLPGSPEIGALNDLDIYIVSDDGDILVDNNSKNIGGDPIEVVSFYVDGDFAAPHIVIRRASGTDNVNFKFIVYEGNSFEFVPNIPGSSTITGHANAAGAMTVGAVLYTHSPAFSGVDSAASFSSRGGLLIGGDNRNKPDFTAPNGANTTVDLNGFDFDLDIYPNFFGTSASAPHAAGVAALLRQSKTKFGFPFETRQLMKETAIDINDPGFDNASGSGFILADAALLTFAAPKPTITELVKPPGATPGVTPFDLIIRGKNLHPTTRVLMEGVELPAASTTIDSATQLTVTIPVFTGDPAIQASTNAITSTGADGGISEPLYLIRPPKKEVMVYTDEKTKRYGEIMPEFTTTVTVDGMTLLEAGLSLANLGLDNLSFSSVANSLTDVGIHRLRANDNTSTMDDSLLELYDYIFVDSGQMIIQKTLLKITPNDLTVYYGDQISDITYIYEYDDSNINPDDNITILENLASSYSFTFVDGDVIAVLDRGRGIVNRGRGIVNGSGWTITPNTLINRGRGIVNGGVLIDIPEVLLEDYELDSSNTLTNRGRGIVNGNPLFSDEAWINRGRGIVNDDGTFTVDRGRGIVNDGAMVNTDEAFTGFDDLIVIVDTSDFAVSSIFSINLVSTLDVTTPESLEYIVPGGYFAQESNNWEITYGLGDLTILPVTLNVTVDDKLMFLEDEVLPKFTSNYDGFQYDENEDNVFSSITYSPTEVDNIGELPIVPTNFNFIDEINYTIPNPVPGILTVRHLTNGRIALATENESGSFDLTLVNSDGSNPITLVPGTVSGSVSDPEFSPDGMEIVFTSNTEESTNLWKINSDGTGLTQMSFDGISGQSDFSPDGSQIVFIQEGDIAVMNRDGSHSRIIVDTPEDEQWPFYSRDGRSMYYARDMGDGKNEIFNIDLGPARSNLISWWPGDGNANDIEGGNHGMLQGGATFGSGQANQAFQLDGIDDFIMVPDGPALYFGTQDFTIDVWVNFTNTNGEQVIIEKWIQKYEDASTGWTLTKLDGDVLRFAIRDGDVNNPEFVLDTAPISISLNSWHHVAITREADIFTLYWNGAVLGTMESSYNLYSASSLKMGHRGNQFDTPGSDSDQDFYLNGSIDEVKIYNRALSISEIQEIYSMEEIQITSDNDFHIQPDLLRDGSKILYTSADNSSEDGSAIITMNPDGTGKSFLYNDLVGGASGSPDSEKIAFKRESDQMKFLQVINVDETGEGIIYEQVDLQLAQPSWGTYPDAIYIPDPNFEQALIDLGIDSDGVINQQILRIDAEGVTTLDVSDPINNENLPNVDEKISNLTGIEAFVNLTILRCYSNELTSLDVSQNTELTDLSCYFNQLTSLDVSQNTELTVLSCYYNKLTSLDVSQNTSLKELLCAWNQLTSLHVSQNTALTYLWCGYNGLTELDVSQNSDLKDLYCGPNKLTSLDVSQNTALTNLQFFNNQLTSIDVTQNNDLKILRCSQNRLTGLDVSQNTALVYLHCDGNQLTSLDVRNGANTILTDFNAEDNNLTCISVDDETAIYLDNWTVDPIVSFSNDCNLAVYIPDANFEQALINLGIDSDGIINEQILTSDALAVSSLDVSDPINNENLPDVTAKIGDLTGIEAFANLTHLYCQLNQLTGLDVSQNTDLTVLSCSLNQLTSLDVSQNTALTQLFCASNQLTSLDVSQNTALAHFWCGFNQLVSLDVRNGNNANITFNARGNIYLSCISVDDACADHSGWDWNIDAGVSFSNDCDLPVYIICNIVLDPDSPAELSYSERVNIAFSYTKLDGDVRIWARPFNEGSLAPGYRAHPSPLYTENTGNVDGYFFFDEDADVDQIRVQIVENGTNEVLFEQFIDVEFNWVDAAEGLSATTSSIESSIIQGNFTVYPNPVRDYLEVVYADETVSVDNMSIIVHDINGFLQENVSFSASIANHGLVLDMNSLPSGIYLVYITAQDDGEVFTIQKE